MTETDHHSGPEPAAPGRGQVRALFDWLADDYDVAVLAYSLAQDLRWKSELIRKLDPRRGEKALDLACGTGLLYDRLDRRLGPGAVVGLDINLRMMTRGRRNGPRRRLVRADSVRLPFREASFDIVTAGYLFKYVPLRRLSEEVRRVLRAGGRFGGYDFSAPTTHSLAGRAYGRYLHSVLPFLARLRGRGDPNWTRLMDFLASVATHSGWESRVESELRSAGFDRVEAVPSLGGAVTWVWAQLPEEHGPSR